jgi:antitoxin component YwqK of YwqJK toxin-antitoxin module
MEDGSEISNDLNVWHEELFCVLDTTKRPWVPGEKYSGLFVGYFDDGQISLLSNVINGGLTGTFFGFSKTGELIEEKTYVDGQIDGPSFTYFLNGQIESKVNYSSGTLEGI